MDTTPVVQTSPMTTHLRTMPDGVVTKIDFEPNDTIVTIHEPWQPIHDLHEPGWSRSCITRYINVDRSGSSPSYIPRPTAIPNLLLLRRPLLAPLANCVVDGMDVIATRPINTGTPLVLQVCPGAVLGRIIPSILEAGSLVFDCPDYLQGRTPCDTEAGTEVSLIDGYLTLDSMGYLASMHQHCSSSAVIGCGYGEIAALLCRARMSSVLTFESIAYRRDMASRLWTQLNIQQYIDSHGTLCDYIGRWPGEPTLIWTNNIRYVESSTSDIPSDLMCATHFPMTDSVLVTMQSFNGEDSIFVCFCGFCKNGEYSANSDSVFRSMSTICTRCGLYYGYQRNTRLMIRAACPAQDAVMLEPYGKGRGVRPAVCYTMHACVEDTPTPEADMHLTSELIESREDYTPKMREMLTFASDWLEGDLLETSMLFHGSVDPANPLEGPELLGIDCAVAFMVEEKGYPIDAYAYRTIGYVRDCGIAGLLRINHDVVHPDQQNKGRISLANTQLARVIERRFPDATAFVIEPDRSVEYHRGYEKGFPWTTKTVLAPQMLKETVSSAVYQKYRRQIDVDPERYQSLYFAIPRGEKRARESDE